ncbi:hypothetical protein [Longispora albida]|uniref:hypothetical protein n=1 Tax=Longispora albida TaxID=203523 RepID=UPI0012FCFA80|nr:hypothetical protein [Longispora albida]
MRRRTALTVGVTGVALFLTLLPGTPGSAAPAKPAPRGVGSISAADKAIMAAQLPLKSAASEIRWAVERESGPAGFAGIGLAGGRVTLWWKGELPKPVAKAVDRARATATVTVEPAAYSREELRTAAAGLSGYLQANRSSPYHTIEVAYDGSALYLGADPGTGLAASALPAGLAGLSPIPVTVVEKTRPSTTGRLDDYAPYYGGGRIQNNDNGAWCTAGWPVTGGRMLTAGHCGRTNGGWNNGNDTRFFGTGAAEHVGHDLLLINASVAGRMWDGGVGSGEFTKGVAGWDWVASSEYLCTSGSRTGAVCNFRVNNVWTYSYCGNDAYGNRECYNDLVTARQLDGRPGSQGGDSGGPVFSLSGADRVIAKGTISGVNGSDLLFQDFGTAWNDFGIGVVTG